MQKLLLSSIMMSLAVGGQATTFKLDLPVENLPDLGSSANSALSSTEEAILGLKFLRELRGSKPVIEDPELSAWLQSLGKRLARHAPNNTQYYFLIINDPAINAYAMPGGVIAIYSGLILNTRSESELAAVIAHEIAHVSQRHIARILAGRSGDSLLTGLGVLVGAAAASQSPDAAQAIISGTLASQAHRQLAFSRQMEAEADRTGLRILAQAGLDPQAMPTFMEKLEQRSNDVHGEITQYLRTHPLSIDRLSDTRSRAAQMGKPSVQENSDYAYAREKLRSITAPNTAAITAGDQSLANYTQALRQLRSGNPQAALQTLGEAKQPQLPLVLLRATAFNRLQRYQDTIALLTPVARESQQSQEGVLVLLAEALLAEGQAKQAWQAFERLPLSEQTSLEFLDMRQRVAEQAAQPVEAYRSAAERSLRMGEYQHAKANLQQASRLAGLPATTLASLQALIRDIERIENQQKQLRKF